jgi:hypothetical protein
VLEDVGPVVSQIGPMLLAQATQFQRSYEAHGRLARTSKQGRYLHVSCVRKSNPSAVVQRVKAGGQQQAIEDVEPLFVRLALGPGPYVRSL